MENRGRVTIWLFAILLATLSFAQTEGEVKQKANELFNVEKYVEATPYFLRLLSLQPKNVEYNYKYGACLLFIANKKDESLRYLKFATSSPGADPLAHYYMGRAYHLNFLFNDAVRSYNKFLDLLGTKNTQMYDVGRLIEMAKNGRRLMMNYSELIVYDQKEIEADKFFRLYDLSEIGGNLLVTVEFQSKIDKKKGHVPLVYFPKNAKEIFYASYGDNESTGKDIYRRKRFAGGGWTEPEKIKGEVNTKYDEDFSYMSQDGNYLYFCSKGHNSMGGYDVFKSVYQPSTDSYNEVENLDFAISSPYDDMLFLVDQNNENGYFASARQSESGKLSVYKIRVEKIPSQISIIAGLFESKIKPDAVQLQVDVEEAATGKVIGSFKSDREGHVVLTFPKGGMYKYTMKIAGTEAIYVANVEIPMKKEIKPLRQNFAHTLDNGREVIKVVDKFEEDVPEREEILAQIFSKNANLKPNTEQYDLNTLHSEAEQKRILAKVGASGKSIAQLNAELKTKIDRINFNNEQAKTFEKKAFTKIEQELNNIAKLGVRLKDIEKKYRAEINLVKKKQLLDESKLLLKKREEAEEKIKATLEINEEFKKSDNESKIDPAVLSEWVRKNNELEKLVQSGRESEGLDLIVKNEITFTDALAKSTDDLQEKSVKKIEEINENITTLNKQKYNYETSISDLENNIKFLEQRKEAAKRNELEEIEKNISTKQQDLKLIRQEVANIETTIVRDKKEKATLTNQLSAYNAVATSQIFNADISQGAVEQKLVAINSGDHLATNDFLNKEIERVERDGDLAFADVTKTNDKLNSGDKTRTPYDIISQVSPNTKEQMLLIDKDTSLNPEGKIVKKSEAELEMKKRLEIEQTRLDYELMVNEDNPVAAEERETVTKLINETDTRLQKLTQDLASERDLIVANNKVENKTTKPTNNNTVRTTKPLESSNEVVENNNSKTTDNKVDVNSPNQTKNLNDLESQDLAYEDLYMQRINIKKDVLKELEQKEAQLAKSPNQKDPTVKEQKEEFAKEKEELLKQIKNDEIALQAKPEAKDQLIARLSPNTAIKIQEIQNDPTLSTHDKMKSSIIAERVLVNNLVMEKQKFMQLRNEYPENSEVQAKIDEIQEIIDNKKAMLHAKDDELAQLENLPEGERNNVVPQNQNKIEENNSKTEGSNSVSNAIKTTQLSDSERRKTIVVSMSSDYYNSREEILSKGDLSKTDLNELLVLDKSMLASLTEKGKELTAKLSDKPDDEEISLQLKTVLELREETQAEIIKSETKLQLVPEEKEQLLARVTSSYADYASKKEVASNNDFVAQEALVKQEKELIEELKKEKARISKIPKDGNYQAVLLKKEKEIDAVLVELNNSVSVRQTNISATKQQLAEQKIQETKPAEVEKVVTTNTTPKETPKPNTNTQATDIKPVESKTDFVKLGAEEKKKTIVVSISADYYNERTRLESSIFPEREKLTELIKLDKELIADLKIQKSDITSNNVSLPAAEKKAKLKTIDELIVETQAGIDQKKGSLLLLPEPKEELTQNENTNTVRKRQTIADVENLRSKVLSSNNQDVMTGSAEDVEGLENQEIGLMQYQTELKILDKAYAEEEKKGVDHSETRQLIAKELKVVKERMNEVRSTIAEKQNVVVANNPSNLSLQQNIAPQTYQSTRTELPSKMMSSANALRFEVLGTNRMNLLSANPSDLGEMINQSKELTTYQAELINLDRLYEEAEKNGEKTGTSRKIIAFELNNIDKKLTPLNDQIVAKGGQLPYDQNVASNNESGTESETGQPKVLRRPVVTVGDVRTEILKGSNADIMEDDRSDLDGLKNKKRGLEGYKGELRSLDQSYIEQEKQGENLSDSREVVAEEMVNVDRKLRQVSVSIGEIETEIIAQNEAKGIKTVTPKYEDNKLEELVQKENAIQAKLAESTTEDKAAQAELARTRDQRVMRENSLLKNESLDLQTVNYAKLDRLEKIETFSELSRVNLDLVKTQFDLFNAESKALEDRAKSSRNQDEVNYLMQESIAKLKDAQNILEIAYIDNKVESASKGGVTTLETKADLDAKIRSLKIQSSRVTSDIYSLQQQVDNTKNKTGLAELEEKMKMLLVQEKLVKDQISYNQVKVAQLAPKPAVSIQSSAKNVDISFVDERKLAATMEYKEVNRLANDAMFIEGQIGTLAKLIEKEKEGVKKLVQSSLILSNNKVESDIFNKVNKIAEKEVQLKLYNEQLLEKQNALKSTLPTDKTKALQMQNLILRGIDPMIIAKVETAIAMVKIPLKGFEVNLKAPTPIAPLPLNVQIPEGLLFRVQVGAFNNPISEETFKEFNPVTGEVRPSGLTVYMAGYFNNSESASDAQKMIQRIGYKDAFMVAFCDGQRITLAEARRLESTKGCIPVNLSQLSMSSKLPNSAVNEAEITEYDYNKAPNAAPADPIEKALGLFFTVQVGVFNRPAEKSAMKEIDNLLTKRLTNGQIRYSSGKYASMELASKAKVDIIEKGIKDAFVTAYFKGERIPLAEANKLLLDNGPSILEKTIGVPSTTANQETNKTVEKTVSTGTVSSNTDTKTKTIEYTQTTPVVKKEEPKSEPKVEMNAPNRIQLVSKKTFDEFPRDALNRFNSHAPFFYDSNDKKIKSAVYSDVEQIPQVYFLRKDIDTLYFRMNESNVKANNSGVVLKNLVFEISKDQLDGDLANLLIRINFRKEYLRKDKTIRVTIIDVNTNAIQSVVDQLKDFGINAAVVDPRF